MYCGTVSFMEVAPVVGIWMRINAERLVREKKDSERLRDLRGEANLDGVIAKPYFSG